MFVAGELTWLNERLMQQCMKLTVKHGSQSIWDVSLTLEFSSQKEVVIVQRPASGVKAVKRGFILQQDNGPKHES